MPRTSLIVLSQFAALCEDQIEVEALAIATAIHDADAGGSSEGFVTVTEQQLKLMIRQQIKAESKTELTDDILVAAYRHRGAYRSAAEYLAKETGQPVSKDAVSRAVQREGGALSQDDLARRLGTEPTDEVDRRETAEAAASALAKMPDELRDVCRRVMGGSISAAAEDLETSRRQIRNALASARPYFEQAGVDAG